MRVSGGGEEQLADAPRRSHDHEFWRRHLWAGVAMYFAGTLIGAMYVYLTPDGPHRGLLWTMVLAAAVSTVPVIKLQEAAIARPSIRLTFFVAWSCSTVVFVAFVSWLDGGLASPLATIMIMPMIYSALAYPVRAAAGVAAFAVLGTSLVAALTDTPLDRSLPFIAILGVVGSSSSFAASQRQLLEEQLVDRAMHDGLTDCLDHRAFYDALDRALAADTVGRVSVAVVDLDDFKNVNDRHGHVTGDEVLRAFGRAMRHVTRDDDLVGRLGGDEFAVAFFDAPIEVTASFPGRLREQLRHERLPLEIEFSSGTARAPSGRRMTAVELVRLADEQLYLDKTRPVATLRSIDPSA